MQTVRSTAALVLGAILFAAQADVQKRDSSGSWASVDPYHPQDGDSLWTQQYGGVAGSLPGHQCQ